MEKHLSEAQRNHLQNRKPPKQQLTNEDSYRAGAIILNKDMTHCLMVFQRRSQLWGVPKGRRENRGEPYRKCMLREVQEETSLDLTQYPFEYLDSLQIHGRCRIYIIRLLISTFPICEPPEENGQENHEIVTTEWTPLGIAFQRHVNSITRKALQNLRGRISELRSWKNIVSPPSMDMIIIPSDIEAILYSDQNKHVYAQ